MNISAPVTRTEAVHDVAVVGSGLVGMACALGAAHAGLSVQLIGVVPPNQAIEGERWDRRVYAISPASRRFLERLHVWHQLDTARIQPVRDMRIYSSVDTGRSLHFSAYEAASPALAWIVEHRELARVLTEALRFAHGIEHHATEATGFEISADQVRVAVGPRKCVCARLLVGADGATSAVRQAADLVAERKPYGQSGVVANFACERAHAGTALQWFARDSILALLPLPGNTCSMVWSAPPALAAELLAASHEALAAHVEAISHSHTGKLLALGGASAFPLSLVTVASISAPRVALVGDAAHVVHPLAGQGLNLGFQDVEVLLDVLGARESFRDCGDGVLMRRFERTRALPILAMRTVTDGLQRLFGAQQVIIRRLRSDGMNLMQGLPVVKKALIRYAMGKF